MNTTSFPSYQRTTALWRLVSPEVSEALRWYFFLVLYPLVGIIGILGSLTSGIVLKKNGLGQSYNILLFVLAISDACCLIETLDIGRILLDIIPIRYPYWKLPYTASYVAYIILMFCSFSTSIGSRVSTYTTVLITVERIIAVFFPLRFVRIVTPKRVWLVTGVVVVLWLPWCCFQMTWYGLDASSGRLLVTIIIGSEMVENVLHFSHLIPFIIVTAGSLIISLKIGITLRQRRQLTHNNSETKVSTNRTNRMLLMICLVFSVTRFTFYLQYLPWLNLNSQSSTIWLNVFFVYSQIRTFLVYLNSAVNFFIYVGLNKKFRSTFKDLWRFTKRSRPPIRSAVAR